MLFLTVVSQSFPRCSRGTRSISGSREVHMKPRANFVGDSYLQAELDGSVAPTLQKKAVKIVELKERVMI